MQKHKVLRPICIDGERVEVGSIVALVPNLGSELRAAGKVERVEGDEDKPAAQPDPRAKVVKASKPPKAEADKSDAPKD